MIPEMMKDRRVYVGDNHSLSVANLPVVQKKMNTLEQDDSFGEGVA